MKIVALTFIASAALVGVAVAATPTRLRGHVVSATASSLVMRTNAGGTVKVALDAAKFAAATPATRADVQPGKYIGTATKTVNGKQVALEVVIFPDSMRGTGDGHYAWDNITDTTATGKSNTPSGMTNGNVTAAVPLRTTHSSMTNGSVSTALNLPGAVTAAGDKQLVVTYKGGSQTVLLPPSAPVIAVAPADETVLAPGGQVFVIALPGKTGLDAVLVVAATKGAKLAM